jgi:membrane-bound serine protease (ClpP class)
MASRAKYLAGMILRRATVLAAGLLAAASGGVAGAPSEPASPAAAAPAAAGPVLRIRIDSAIHPVVAEFLEHALEEADARSAEVLVIELATPGGLLEATRRMFSAMLAARTPTVVYVAPSGAQAASAGFFLLMAADVAAMAPGTNTGAAHPVGGQGEEIEGTLGEKVEQDSAATIRSLAARHGRNVALAEAAVVESRSFTADEALAEGLVELVAPSLQGLLVELDGRSVEKGGETHVLATAEAELVTVEMSVFRRVLSVLVNPSLAYIFLSLGMLGLYFELMNPGSVVPGVVGVIFLLLALPALAVLPVNYAGIALIVLAIVLFIAEIKVTSYGLLTGGGILALALGGIMLFDSPLPALRVSLELVAGVSLFTLVVVGALLRLAVRAQKSKVRTGSEGLVGEVGRAVEPLAPPSIARPGKVFVHGEYWHAVADRPLPAGTPIEVTAVEGMVLRVRPHAWAAEPPAPEALAGGGGESGG